MYRYEDPTKHGYRRVSVSRKEHNDAFPLRKSKIGGAVQWFYHDEMKILKIQRFTKPTAKVLIILIGFLPSVIMEGLPQALKDCKNIIWEKRDGHFVEDTLSMQHAKIPENILKILKR